MSDSCDAMDYSPAGSSVRGIVLALALEWAVISFSRGSSRPRDGTQVPALQADSLSTEPCRKCILSLPESVHVDVLYV